ncbi:hypothetical protein D3C85_914260 [compost metagenome]
MSLPSAVPYASIKPWLGANEAHPWKPLGDINISTPLKALHCGSLLDKREKIISELLVVKRSA